MAIFAFLQVVVTGITLLGLRHARIAAEAAKASIDHLATIERAYVFGGIEKIVRDETGAVTLDVTLSNVGRTPARVRKLTMGTVGFDPRDGTVRLPSEIADYSTADVYPADTVFGGPEKGVVTQLEKLPTFGAVYGLIEYDDIFREPHKSRFCLSYDGLKGVAGTFGNASWNEYD